ncbi:MAG: hypothetical protein ACRDUV_10120 [Pseudonocardiaceae bacterium]
MRTWLKFSHLGGTITYIPHSITVRLDRPTTPKITRALALLTDQLNTNPPHIPGDPGPITCTMINIQRCRNPSDV